MPSMKLPPFFNVMPVKDKKPQVSWSEFIDRAQTPEEKAAFSGAETLGVITGPVSRIIVLDDDGGLDADRMRALPRTWTAKTPRGGRHYYFKWSSSLDSKVTTKTGILPGVDIRGQGGYVVFYGFERLYLSTPLASPPQWLIDLLPNKERQAPPALGNAIEMSELARLLDGIKEGNRNDSFTRIAGSLRARGYSVDEMLMLLGPKAREVAFSETELRTVCQSVGRYAPRIAVADESALSIDKFLTEIEPVEWIVPGIIAKKSIGFVVGLPETKKTWALMDLAIQCARGGGLWLNKFPVSGAKVLFIDQERFKGETQRRFLRLLDGPPTCTNLGSALAVKSGTSIRLNIQPSFDAFRREMAEIRPDIVIVDSFATFHTVEENNRQSIQTVLERIKELRNEFGCTFLFIHHESKMAFNTEDAGEPSISQMAGSVAIPAAAEMVLTVRKHEGENSMVYMTKSTQGPRIAPFLLKVRDLDSQRTVVEAY
jgi:hypothetical protein